MLEAKHLEASLPWPDKKGFWVLDLLWENKTKYFQPRLDKFELDEQRNKQTNSNIS